MLLAPLPPTSLVADCAVPPEVVSCLSLLPSHRQQQNAPGAGVACTGSQLDVRLTQANRTEGDPQLLVGSAARSLPVKRRRKMQYLRCVE